MKTLGNTKERSTRRIRPSRARTRRVEPRELAAALGAEVVISPAETRGSTPAMLAARSELLHRLRSRGGRPGLRGATMRRQVSFTPKDWEDLERIATAIEENEGLRTTPGQVASALVHRLLEARE